MPKGTHSRVHTYPSGKKVREIVSSSGKILRTTPIQSKASRTKTGKRLNKRRKRINR